MNFWKVMDALLTQLRDRGGILLADAGYWIPAMKKAAEEDAARKEEVDARLAELENKIEFLAEHTGAKPLGLLEGETDMPVQEGGYLEEDPQPPEEA